MNRRFTAFCLTVLLLTLCTAPVSSGAASLPEDIGEPVYPVYSEQDFTEPVYPAFPGPEIEIAEPVYPASPGQDSSIRIYAEDLSDFVLLSEAVPDAILEIRYYSTYNFVGERIDGYEEPVAILTKEAAAALKEVSDELLPLGYRLKIYDAYRPQKAVDHFVRWSMDPNDVRMKAFFYPDLDKSLLFPEGYIASKSGHSRGSTVDLTLFNMYTGKEVDMGGTFDHFGIESHGSYTGVTQEQYDNRMFLQNIMTAHGFLPYYGEWWHFTLQNEPYPDTYFTFPVRSDLVAGNAFDEGAAEENPS